MAKYFVTGATGFIGGEIVKQLIGRGHTVVALVRSPDKAGMLKALGVQIHAGDVTDRETLRAPMTGVDGVFHVAAWYKVGVTEPLADQINVDGTRNVLSAATDAATPRVVYTSTLAVNGDTGGRTVDESYRFTGSHLTAYDASKAAAHALVDQTDHERLPVVTVMPGGVYGPGDTGQIGALMARIAAGKRVVVTAGPRMCQAHVEDVARGHLLAMQRGQPGQSYMLAGPQIALGDLLDLVADIAGTGRPLRVPTPALRALTGLAGSLGSVLPLPPTYSAETMRVAAASYLGSPAKARRDLGWTCRPLRQGIEQTVGALRGDA